jgi:hypothetical protein
VHSYYARAAQDPCPSLRITKRIALLYFTPFNWLAVCSSGNIDVQLVCDNSQEIALEVDLGTTRLFLIRHADVDTGKDGQRMCGWLDLPLSLTGELQLQTLQENSDFAWPNGESYKNFRDRIFVALGRLASSHTNAGVAVLTHAGAIAQVVGAYHVSRVHALTL